LATVLLSDKVPALRKRLPLRTAATFEAGNRANRAGVHNGFP